MSVEVVTTNQIDCPVTAAVQADIVATGGEQAFGLAGQALDQLSDSWYATGYERVQAVRV